VQVVNELFVSEARFLVVVVQTSSALILTIKPLTLVDDSPLFIVERTKPISFAFKDATSKDIALII
jgi:hypothetical protein